MTSQIAILVPHSPKYCPTTPLRKSIESDQPHGTPMPFPDGVLDVEGSRVQVALLLGSFTALSAYGGIRPGVNAG